MNPETWMTITGPSGSATLRNTPARTLLRGRSARRGMRRAPGTKRAQGNYAGRAANERRHGVGLEFTSGSFHHARRLNRRPRPETGWRFTQQILGVIGLGLAAGDRALGVAPKELANQLLALIELVQPFFRMGAKFLVF